MARTTTGGQRPAQSKTDLPDRGDSPDADPTYEFHSEDPGDEDEPSREPEPIKVAYPAALLSGGKPVPGADLFMEVCEIFGIHPDPAKDPHPEVLNWKYYPPAYRGAEDAVVVVTSGGLKIRYPLDADTTERLQKLWGLISLDKDGKQVIKPFPQDMTLPKNAVDGRVMASDHVYQGGYLRSGGKAEGARRQARFAK